MPEVTARESLDGASRTVDYCRGGQPVVGLKISPGGTITVGRWLADGRWVTLHVSVPEEPSAPRIDVVARITPGGWAAHRADDQDVKITEALTLSSLDARLRTLDPRHCIVTVFDPREGER